MKLSKKTIAKCHEAGTNVYTAKKVTNNYGTWITITYATRLFKNGICTAVTTEKKITIEGNTQEDIVNYFCNM